MAYALISNGFLTQATVFGFRIGATQCPGREEVESFLAGPDRVVTPDQASVPAAFARLCGICLPARGVFAAKPAQVGPASPTATDRIIEGFTALIGILTDGLKEDLQAALTILEIGSIPVVLHDPSDYDAVCIAFDEAAAQARSELRYGQRNRTAAALLPHLASFTDAANSADPMDLLTWCLRAMADLPDGWEVPAAILQLLTARIEWKLLLFPTAAETLQDVARQVKRMRREGHDWEFDAEVHYLAGMALLVTSFSGSKDAFGEAIDAFRASLDGFEKAEMAGREIRERFSQCFTMIGDILDSRGRHEEAATAFRLAAAERENAATSRR